jgi:hypothetical protein
VGQLISKPADVNVQCPGPHPFAIAPDVFEQYLLRDQFTVPLEQIEYLGFLLRQMNSRIRLLLCPSQHPEK